MATVGFMSRVKSLFGAGPATPLTVAAATTLSVPDGLAWVNLTGTASVTSLTASLSARNRVVIFYQSDAGATTFTNTNGASTAGTMDLGGSDVVLAATDVLCLFLRSNGSWVRVWSTDN